MKDKIIEPQGASDMEYIIEHMGDIGIDRTSFKVKHRDIDFSAYIPVRKILLNHKEALKQYLVLMYNELIIKNNENS